MNYLHKECTVCGAALRKARANCQRFKRFTCSPACSGAIRALRMAARYRHGDPDHSAPMPIVYMAW
jgi:hypothetical protein